MDSRAMPSPADPAAPRIRHAGPPLGVNLITQKALFLVPLTTVSGICLADCRGICLAEHDRGHRARDRCARRTRRAWPGYVAQSIGHVRRAEWVSNVIAW